MNAAPNESPADVAAQLNRELADQIKRWMRVRAAFAVGLTVGAVALCFTDGFLLAPPTLLAAALAILLWLAARDDLREVSARRWRSPTPRISLLKSRPPAAVERPAP